MFLNETCTMGCALCVGPTEMHMQMLLAVVEASPL